MKFNKIKVGDKITSGKGIKEINISRLSNVVALVGKNGSGKTRILDILEENLFKDFVIQRLVDKSITGLNKTLKAIVDKLSPFSYALIAQERLRELNLKRKADPSNSVYQNEISEIRSNPQHKIPPNNLTQVNELLDEATKILPTLKQKYLRRINYSDVQNIQKVIDDSSDQGSITFEDLIENVSKVEEYDEIKSIHRSGLEYLSKLPHLLAFDTFDSSFNKDDYEQRIAHKRFLSLKRFIKYFLNKNLTWEKKSSINNFSKDGIHAIYSGVWNLEDQPFDYEKFSDGEKALFSYALLFFLLDQNPDLNIKGSIILVDEPELHLHPDAEIDLINGIRNAIGENGQLIFATHSINILSSLNYDEIFMVKNGVIKHPSQATIGESLSELMGIEDRVNKLSDFLSSIATWTFVNFMAECFSDPGVIDSARPDDPQIAAFKQAVIQSSGKDSNLLLDFGAGKGRLYEHLKSDYDFIEKVSYSALEPEGAFHENLRLLGAKEVYNSHSQLPKANFDFILLCNVLHEIPIKEWVDSLNSVITALKDDGFLIIIEAKLLTKGEKIGTEGFILLDLEELKVLFNLNELPSSINIKGKEDIITCAVIPKQQLNTINKADLLETLRELEKNTLRKLIGLREGYDETKKNMSSIGRKNAFLSQLHINSRIAQLTLSDNTSSAHELY